MTDPLYFVTGATGYLGHQVTRSLVERGVDFRPLGREDGIDLEDPFGLETRWERMLAGLPRPAVLLHLAAMSRWVECEHSPELAWRVNCESTGVLASVLRRRESRIVYVSTDLVFDGEHAPYSEQDEARPTSVYGKTKLCGEGMVRGNDDSLVLRVPLLYGPSFDGARGASDSLLRAVAAGQEVRLFTDEWRTPLHVAEAARRVVELTLDPSVIGLRHLPGPERLSRWQLGQRIAAEARIDPSLLHEASRFEMTGPPRPRDCSLETIF